MTRICDSRHVAAAGLELLFEIGPSQALHKRCGTFDGYAPVRPTILIQAIWFRERTVAEPNYRFAGLVMESFA